MSTMLAVRPERAGDPAELTAVVTERPTAADGEVLIRVAAAAVNRSDALACRGILIGPFPRILGRDFTGEVVEGPHAWRGRRVWGTGGGDIGLARDGSHAEYLTAPVDGIALTPDRLSDVEAAASGLAYFTAATALQRAGALTEGCTVVTTGAGGGVGGAATSLAAWRGARVLAVVRGEREAELARTNGAEIIIRSDTDDVTAAILSHTDGVGAAVAVDAVGGELTVKVLGGLAIQGGLCVLSSPPAAALAVIDMLDFYRRELRLIGLHTGRLTSVDAAAVLRSLSDGFEIGALKPAPTYASHPLEEAAQAYLEVERQVPGRPVFVPHHR